MIERIKENEERLDKINACIKQMEDAILFMKFIQKDMALLNKYYGSKEWFKDKEAYENGNIPRIKAGVLSEDAIWNMNENYKDLIVELKELI